MQDEESHEKTTHESRKWHVLCLISITISQVIYTVLVYMEEQRAKFNLKVFDVFDGLALVLRMLAVAYIFALIVKGIRRFGRGCSASVVCMVGVLALNGYREASMIGTLWIKIGNVETDFLHYQVYYVSPIIDLVTVVFLAGLFIKASLHSAIPESQALVGSRPKHGS